MENTIVQLKEDILVRRAIWQEAKDPNHATSVFVCNRRIQKLNEALELIVFIELIEEYTKR